MSPRQEKAAEWVSINSLVEWDKNPRVNDHVVDDVIKSIQRFGFGAPIVAMKSTKEIIAGHTRLKAAKQLGLKKVPVRFLDLSEEEAHALALADNKLGELANWSDDLPEVLRALGDTKIELTGLGWTDDELGSLMDSLNVVSEPEPEDPSADDELPEEVEATTKTGDVIQVGRHVLHCGDCIEVMKGMDDCSVDSIVTDPPYGLSPDKKARTWDDLAEMNGKAKSGFMGAAWDAAVPGVTWAKECLRVLKPGGHLIAFGGTRTIHRLTCAIEDAGFEIRECIHWQHYQGFPKSLDISKAIDKAVGAEREVVGVRKTGIGTGRGSVPIMGDGTRDITAPSTPEAKQWDGWGTALKPSVEPAVLARKPLDSGMTIAENVLAYGTGALNIDACRYPQGDKAWPGPQEELQYTHSEATGKSAGGAQNYGTRERIESGPNKLGRWPANLYACSKPSRKERDVGIEQEQSVPGVQGNQYMGVDSAGSRSTTTRNFHSTVKPSRLMRWLVRLVTPLGGICLEPFAGSGTTLIACEREGFSCIGIEREPKYCDLTLARLRHAVNDE
jgi:DNA modification methylase